MHQRLVKVNCLPTDLETIIYKNLHELIFANEVLPDLKQTTKRYPSVHICDKHCRAILSGFMGCPANWRYYDIEFDSNDINEKWNRRQVNSDGSVVLL